MSECSFGSICTSDHIQDSKGRCVSKSSPAGKILVRAQSRLQSEITGGNISVNSDLSTEIILLQNNVKQLMDAVKNDRNLPNLEFFKKNLFSEIDKFRNDLFMHSEKVESVTKSNKELIGIDLRIKSDVQMLNEARTEIAKLLLETKKTLEQVNSIQAESSKDIVISSKSIKEAQALQKILNVALEQFHSKHVELKTASIELQHRVQTQIDELAKLKSTAIETFAGVTEQVFTKMQTLEQAMKIKLNDFISKAQDDASIKIASGTKNVIMHCEEASINVMKESKLQIQKDTEFEIDNIKNGLEVIKQDANTTLQAAIDFAKTSSIEAQTLMSNVNNAQKLLQSEVNEFNANAEKVKLAMHDNIKSITQETMYANNLGDGIAALTQSLTANLNLPNYKKDSVQASSQNSQPQQSSQESQNSMSQKQSNAEIELNAIIKEFNRAQIRVQQDKDRYNDFQEKIINDHKAAENYMEAIKIKQQSSTLLKVQYAQVSQALDRVQQASLRTPKNPTVQFQLEQAIEARELLDSSIKQIEMDIANLNAKYNAAVAMVDTEVQNAKLFHKQAEDHITKALSLNDQVTRGKTAIEIARAIQLNGGSITEDHRFEIELEAGQNLIKAGHMNHSPYYKNKMNALRAHLDGGGSLDNLELI